MISRGVRLEEDNGVWSLHFQVDGEEWQLGKLDAPEAGDELKVRIKFTRAVKASGEPDLLTFVEIESEHEPDLAGTRQDAPGQRPEGNHGRRH